MNSSGKDQGKSGHSAMVKLHKCRGLINHARVQESLLSGGDIWATWQPLNVGMESEGEVKDWGQGGLAEPLDSPGGNVQLILR